MKSIKKMMDPEYENLKKELEKLGKYLDFKNRNFCKRYLRRIIKDYFKD